MDKHGVGDVSTTSVNTDAPRAVIHLLYSAVVAAAACIAIWGVAQLFGNDGVLVVNYLIILSGFGAVMWCVMTAVDIAINVRRFDVSPLSERVSADVWGNALVIPIISVVLSVALAAAAVVVSIGSTEVIWRVAVGVGLIVVMGLGFMVAAGMRAIAQARGDEIVPDDPSSPATPQQRQDRYSEDRKKLMARRRRIAKEARDQRIGVLVPEKPTESQPSSVWPASQASTDAKKLMRDALLVAGTCSVTSLAAMVLLVGVGTVDSEHRLGLKIAFTFVAFTSLTVALFTAVRLVLRSNMLGEQRRACQIARRDLVGRVRQSEPCSCCQFSSRGHCSILAVSVAAFAGAVIGGVVGRRGTRK